MLAHTLSIPRQITRVRVEHAQCARSRRRRVPAHFRTCHRHRRLRRLHRRRLASPFSIIHHQSIHANERSPAGGLPRGGRPRRARGIVFRPSSDHPPTILRLHRRRSRRLLCRTYRHPLHHTHRAPLLPSSWSSFSLLLLLLLSLLPSCASSQRNGSANFGKRRAGAGHACSHRQPCSLELARRRKPHRCACCRLVCHRFESQVVSFGCCCSRHCG